MGNNKIMVTGGMGFLGSHLIEHLGKVTNIDIKSKCEWDLSDYTQAEYVIKKAKPEIIFDLATLPLNKSIEEPYEVCEKIFMIGLNLCELLRKGYYKKLVHISSSEAFGSGDYIPMDENHPTKPKTPYASSKASQDMTILSYVNTFGINAIIPRCFNMYGERQHLSLGGVVPRTICAILKGEEPVIRGDGSQSRDFSYVKDIVKGIVSISRLEDSGKIINLGTGTQTSIKELIEKICELMKYKGKIRYEKERVADVTRHCADTTLAKKLIRYEPTYSLEEGLKRTIKYYVDTLSVK